MAIKKFFRSVLPLAGILLLIYLLNQIGLEKIFTVKITNISYIILALLVIPLALILQTFKWKLILKLQKTDIDFISLFKINLIGLFYGTITPGKVGSFIKISYLKDKTKLDAATSSSSVILDRLFDLSSISILAFVGSLLLVNQISNLLFVILLITFFFIAFFYVISNQKLTERFLRLLYVRLIPQKYKPIAKRSFYSFYSNMPKISHLLLPFSLSILLYLLLYTGGCFIFYSAGISIPYIYLVTIIPIATLVGLIPITISGFGTREATLIALLSIFNVLPEQALVLSILGYLILTVLPSLAGGILSLFYK
ncbi:lysylphosphatidylglycerol synthase transmembrane domain-containing protein [Candidatus Undinarchaeota archaeon]